MRGSSLISPSPWLRRRDLLLSLEVEREGDGRGVDSWLVDGRGVISRELDVGASAEFAAAACAGVLREKLLVSSSKLSNASASWLSRSGVSGSNMFACGCGRGPMIGTRRRSEVVVAARVAVCMEDNVGVATRRGGNGNGSGSGRFCAIGISETVVVMFPGGVSDMTSFSLDPAIFVWAAVLAGARSVVGGEEVIVGGGD